MKHILPTIVIAQFLCTSLWFAGNAVLPELAASLQLPASYLGHLTSAVQIGFIVGTLIFAMLTIADKYSPSKVFLISALIASIFNGMMALQSMEAWQLLLYRFGTGFFLAGIYPVGMKIAADYFEKGLGQSLGFLVGALVLGTAFPHLVRSVTDAFPWEFAIYATSILAVLGGLLIYFLIPDGPFRKPATKFNPSAFFKVFQVKNFRYAAFGYFGHMWELYAFWAFVPVILIAISGNQELDISFWSFLIIAVGGISCALGGIISKVVPPKKIAFTALALSATCCLLSPLVLNIPNPSIVLIFLLIWGLAVTADSPMFSTLVAKNAPSASKGTSLTIVNSLGFGITILSIQLLNFMARSIPTPYLFLILALGPLLSLIATARIKIQH
ncbi:MFS transporter [Belliella pelovolcani]|uniref:MFS transporter n=1 Tax=Belliella pelovolcani TaxID=529505 RepID=UPI00391CD266